VLPKDSSWFGESVPERRPYGAVVLVRRVDPDGRERYALYTAPVPGRWRPPLAVRRDGETVEAAVRRELARRFGGLTTEPRMVEAGFGWQVWAAELTREAEAVLLRVEGRTWADEAEAAELGCPDDVVALLSPPWPEALRARPVKPVGEYSGITFRFALTTGWHPYAWPILVIAFAGEYGFGSGGNGDGRFMAGVVRMGLELFEPSGVVLDLKRLRYGWGDMMTLPISAASLHGVEPAIVVSSLCRQAMTSLLRDEMGCRPADLLCRSREQAVANLTDRLGNGYAVALALLDPDEPTFEPETMATMLRTPGARGAALREQIWAMRGESARLTPADLALARDLLVAEAEAADPERPGTFNWARLNRFLLHYELAGLDTVVDVFALAAGRRPPHYLADLPTPLLELFHERLDQRIARGGDPARSRALRVARDEFAAARGERNTRLAALMPHHVW
jgi:hypothetical protein